MSKTPVGKADRREVDRRTVIKMTGVAAAAVGLSGATVFSERLLTYLKSIASVAPVTLPPFPEKTLKLARAAIRAIIHAHDLDKRSMKKIQAFDAIATDARPDTMTIKEIRARHGEFAARLAESFHATNLETDHYRTYGPAILALPVEEWDAAFVTHDEWNCVGAFEHLLDAAKESAFIDGARAEAIVSFVRAHLGTIPAPVNAEFMLAMLPSRVHLAHARVLFATKRYDVALREINQGMETVRAATPVHAHDEAEFRLLRANVLARMNEHEEAVLDYLACGLYYAEVRMHRVLVDSVCEAGFILCAHSAFETAAPALTLANEIADGFPQGDGEHEHPSERFKYALNNCVALGYRPLETNLMAVEMVGLKR